MKNMTEKDINKCLKNGISEIAPNCLDEIMDKLSTKDDNLEPMGTQQQWRGNKVVGYLVSMAALFAVLVGSYGYQQYDLHKVTTVVELDVNPSIEFSADKSDKVVKVKALNDDGAKILENLSLENENVKKATLEVMDELVEYGFITKEKSTVLVSVENKNQDKTEEIKESLSKEIKEHLKKEDIKITVFKQTITKDEVSENIAKEYNISKGKAQLVKTVMEENSALKENELVQMTVDELARQVSDETAHYLQDSYKVSSEENVKGETGHHATPKEMTRGTTTKVTVTEEPVKSLKSHMAKVSPTVSESENHGRQNKTSQISEKDEKREHMKSSEENKDRETAKTWEGSGQNKITRMPESDTKKAVTKAPDDNANVRPEKTQKKNEQTHNSEKNEPQKAEKTREDDKKEESTRESGDTEVVEEKPTKIPENQRDEKPVDIPLEHEEREHEHDSDSHERPEKKPKDPEGKDDTHQDRENH